jgi:hypothetical protein
MKMIRIALCAVLAAVTLQSAAQPRDAVDQPLRRLQISVRFDDSIERRVQALEGQRAYIPSGQPKPVMQRRIIQTPAGPVPQDSFVVQEAITGLEVVPRISGDQVLMEVTPQRQSFDRQGGARDPQVTSKVTTSASGRLGEWFELAAIASSDSRTRIWVKVEEIGN